VRIRLAILVTLVACTDHGVERLTRIKHDVCACKDTHCADQAMSEVPRVPIRSTSRTQAIARDMVECRARLEAAERPSTDPDAEDGAGSDEDSPAPAGSAAPAPAKAAPAKAAPAKAAR
jgi:hypothetical protein